MKKHLLFFVLLFTCTTMSFSQDYREMIAAKTYSVFEIQAAAEPYFQSKGTGKGTGYKQYKRWEYNALHTMDEAGYLPSAEALMNEFFTVRASKQNRMDTSNWEELGPTTWNSTSGWNPGVGRITSFAVDPADQDHIIVGSPSGGVWRTTNGGTNWTVLTDDFINIDVYALAIHPVNKDTYYWGSTSGIIFVTTDAGVTWNQLVNLSGSDVNKILINPNNPDMIFCSIAGGGIFRSTNAGANWSGTLTGESAGYDIEFKPGDTNTLYATGNRFYKSTDGGASFGEVSSPFTAGQTKMIGVSIADPTVVYVLEENSGIFGGFYRSTNSGTSFTQLTHTANYFGYSDTGNDTRGQAPRDMDIVVSPLNIDEVHIAGIHTWRSLNGGVSFALSSFWSEGGAISRNVGYCHADVDIMEFVGTNLYVGSDGGLYINTNTAATITNNYYTDLTAGLGIRQFYKIGVSQTNPEVIVGGSQDNGSSFYNTSGQWFDWLGADGMENFVDKNNSNIFYGTSQGGSLYKSTNGGSSYFGLSEPDGKSGNWVTPFEQDPITQNVIYTGYDQVYKSLNGGTSWTAISQDFGPNMDYLKIAASNNLVMYGSVDGNLYKTIDGGATNWSTVTGYSGSFINDIAIHPTDPNRVAIATNSSDKVYVSDDGGATWTAMRLNLPNYTTYSLVWENSAVNRLFVGMNYGIYYIDDNLTQWQLYSNNLPNVRVYEMEINTANGKLYAGTYGRGVFRSLLPDVASDTEAPTAPTNLTASNITQTTVDLAWTGSTDNIGVTGYEVFQDAVSIGTSAITSFNVTGLTPSTSYDFTVSAFDAAGNDSTLSNVETVMTLAALPVNCTTSVSAIPYSESFEVFNDLGLWTQVGGDDGDWVQDNLGTPSAGTGPSTGSDGDYYLFLEASTNGSTGEIGANATAILEGPCIDLSTFANVQFTFDYHAFGTNIGTASLVVQGSIADGIWFDLFTSPAPLTSQDLWISETIDLSSYSQDIKLRFVGTTGNGWSSDLAIDNVGFSTLPFVCLGVTKTWNGASWSPSGIPDPTNAVVLNGNYNTAVHGDLEACSLTINVGVTLDASASNYIRVENDIQVDGSLLVAHTGNVVQVSNSAVVTNNGTINVNITTPNLASRDFMVLGSPMTAETRNGVFNTSFLVLDHTTANFVPHPDVTVQFPAAENFADDNGDFWNAYNGSIDPAEGYIVRPQAGYGQPGGIFDFTYLQGTLNNGNVGYPMVYNSSKNDSPNVLANPYASALSADDFISANAMVDEVYFWEHLTPPNTSLPGAGSMNFSMEDISMYNLAGGVAAAADLTGTDTMPNGIISTGQGFGVKTNASGTAIFNNAMRRTSGNTTLRNPETLDRVWLSVSSDEFEMSSNTLIGFTETASVGWDAGYDSRRLASVVSLFSHLEADGSKELGIQTLPTLGEDSKASLGFSTLIDAQTSYTIAMIQREGTRIEYVEVFLYDNELNILTNLTQTDYHFTSRKGTYNQRFTLLFEGETLGVEGILHTSNLKVYPNPTSGKLQVVSTTNTFITQAVIMDLQGRVLKTIPINDRLGTIDLSEFGSATYLLKLTTEEGVETIKRIIKE